MRTASILPSYFCAPIRLPMPQDVVIGTEDADPSIEVGEQDEVCRGRAGEGGDEGRLSQNFGRVGRGKVVVLDGDLGEELELPPLRTEASTRAGDDAKWSGRTAGAARAAAGGVARGVTMVTGRVSSANSPYQS